MHVLFVYFQNNISPTWNLHYQNSNKDKHLVTFDVGKNKQIGFHHYFFSQTKSLFKKSYIDIVHTKSSLI